MERGIWTPGHLEIRRSGGGAPRLAGSFPYGKTATIKKAGTVRKERIISGAFNFAIDAPERDINLLWGHSFDKPLASKLGGSLIIRDTEEALIFEAELPPIDIQPSWVRDALNSVEAGLVGGISPGFSKPVIDRLVPEPGNPDVMIREVMDALLIELSLVTRPAYKSTSVESRDDQERQALPLWL